MVLRRRRRCGVRFAAAQGSQHTAGRAEVRPLRQCRGTALHRPHPGAALTPRRIRDLFRCNVMRFLLRSVRRDSNMIFQSRMFEVHISLRPDIRSGKWESIFTKATRILQSQEGPALNPGEHRRRRPAGSSADDCRENPANPYRSAPFPGPEDSAMPEIPPAA
jgi:hypothetical protein